MVYVLNAGHEVLLFAVTGFVIILAAFIIVLLCRCCRKCRRSNRSQHPEDFISESPAAPLIPPYGQVRQAPPYPGGTFYVSSAGGGEHGGGYQQHLIYAPGPEYYNRLPQNNGEFETVQNPFAISGNQPDHTGFVPNAPPYGGEPPPPYDSIRESQQHRLYPGQIPEQNFSYQQQPPKDNSQEK